jgi:hypothetical protein
MRIHDEYLLSESMETNLARYSEPVRQVVMDSMFSQQEAPILPLVFGFRVPFASFLFLVVVDLDAEHFLALQMQSKRLRASHFFSIT